jgi:hypothetical protein
MTTAKETSNLDLIRHHLLGDNISVKLENPSPEFDYIHIFQKTQIFSLSLKAMI